MKNSRIDRSKATQDGSLRAPNLLASFFLLASCFALLFLFLTVQSSQAARIKDISYINGVRSNQLIGYGLVIGLKGTGDKTNTIFTNQSLSNMLEKMGVRVDPAVAKVKNIAAVVVTADLPPFSKMGNKIDVVVSSIGDATSIEGGVLVLTPLRGVDGEIYGMAQGPIVVGGFLASGVGASVTKNHPTVGRIANGVTVERELNYDHYNKLDTIMISLRTPDFTSTRRVVERINTMFEGAARAKDGGTISVTTPEELKSNPVKFLSMIENLDIKPDGQAKIVVDEKNGTVVIGENVRISTVAISHGNLSVQIKEDTKVSQPMPFSMGQTVVTPDTKIKVEEQKSKFIVMEGGVTIRELVNALNAIGVSPRDMIVILQTIKAAGALYAELEVI
ncbi:MAG: flagellar biosynthesis protein FlgA [Syntrophus sp. (in: bacteria)]|nr:flagellar biosynthesis protein FlgA [Syntrophus sp. (in: bacteria)]